MFNSRKKIEELERKTRALECAYKRLEERLDIQERELEVANFCLYTGKDKTEIGVGYDGYTSYVTFKYLYKNEIKKVKFPLAFSDRRNIKIIKENCDSAIITKGNTFYMLDKAQAVVVELPQITEEEVTAE